MKIYTRTGDQGETGLFKGPRVRKDAPRIEAYGDVDELNALLGLVRSAGLPGDVDEVIARVQHQLFSVGAELATPNAAAQSMTGVHPLHVAELELAIDRFEATLPRLTQFILPGGSMPASLLHLARTVCRRAERRIVGLSGSSGEAVSDVLLAYVNRLSDLLFVLARATNSAVGHPDVPWQKPQ
jgi:cob(I)alamin adenosyltransferase